jgi:hypothetical protein
MSEQWEKWKEERGAKRMLVYRIEPRYMEGQCVVAGISTEGRGVAEGRGTLDLIPIKKRES